MDILSFALGYKKGKSTGGGGGTSGDERVKYVTFMNGDRELLRYPVISGDTCRDPVTLELIDTPTKEQTVSTVYTYSGWALTDGGAASSSALANVTEDRTVYVAFTEAARMYTINFYDGETLLKSDQVAYGEVPSYGTIPEKEGCSFVEWQPAVTSVIDNADYYAQWEEKVTFATGSWADIAAISESGQAADYFSVGDTREEAGFEFQIAALNHDKNSSGATMGLTIVLKRTTFSTRINSHTGNNGGYGGNGGPGDQIAQHISKLPESLQNVIKPVVKYYNAPQFNSGSILGSRSFKVWLLSCMEVFGTDPNALTDLPDTQYPLFVTPENKYRYTGESQTPVSWWLRDSSGRGVNSGSTWYNVTSSGGRSYQAGTGYLAAILGFCI